MIKLQIPSLSTRVTNPNRSFRQRPASKSPTATSRPNPWSARQAPTTKQPRTCRADRSKRSTLTHLTSQPMDVDRHNLRAYYEEEARLRLRKPVAGGRVDLRDEFMSLLNAERRRSVV